GSGSVGPGCVSPFQRASQIRVAQSTWCKLPAIVPKYASTGLASSSAIIPSIAARILSFAHWLYATSFRSWLLSAIAVPILAFTFGINRLADVRRDACGPRRGGSYGLFRTVAESFAMTPSLWTTITFEAQRR